MSSTNPLITITSCHDWTKKETDIKEAEYVTKDYARGRNILASFSGPISLFLFNICLRKYFYIFYKTLLFPTWNLFLNPQWTEFNERSCNKTGKKGII